MLEEARGALARSEEEAKEQILRLRGQLERSEAGAASARQELQAVFVRLAADHKEREALRAQGLRMREEIEPLRESLESERCLREQAEADTSRLQGQAQAAEEHLTTAQGTVARLQKELEDARATHGVAKAADAPEEERTPARTTDDDTLAGVFDAELPLPADSTSGTSRVVHQGRTPRGARRCRWARRHHLPIRTHAACSARGAHLIDVFASKSSVIVYLPCAVGGCAGACTRTKRQKS